MSLEGKVAIITGSTSGIGKAAARLLAGDGVKVLVTGLDSPGGEQTVQEIIHSGGEAFFVEADLLNPGTPATLVQQTVERWGRLDIVVNNAAMVCSKPIEQITHADWDRLFQVNLKAPFFLIQESLPWLRQRKGSVINVSSINAIRNAPNNVVYDTLKAALNHMTTGLALDLKEAGVRLNVLMPGGVATPLLNEWFRQFIEDPAEADRAADASKQQPSVGSPEQIALAILYLCREELSWINGAAIPVDGGFHL